MALNTYTIQSKCSGMKSHAINTIFVKTINTLYHSAIKYNNPPQPSETVVLKPNKN